MLRLCHCSGDFDNNTLGDRTFFGLTLPPSCVVDARMNVFATFVGVLAVVALTVTGLTVMLLFILGNLDGVDVVPMMEFDRLFVVKTVNALLLARVFTACLLVAIVV